MARWSQHQCIISARARRHYITVQLQRWQRSAPAAEPAGEGRGGGSRFIFRPHCAGRPLEPAVTRTVRRWTGSVGAGIVDAQSVVPLGLPRAGGDMNNPRPAGDLPTSCGDAYKLRPSMKSKTISKNISLSSIYGGSVAAALRPPALTGMPRLGADSDFTIACIAHENMCS